MLTLLFRIAITLSGTYADHASPGEATHEAAHVLCERSVYESLAPWCVEDSCIDPAAEAAAEALCRNSCGQW